MSKPACSTGCVKAMVDNITTKDNNYYQSCDYGNLYLDMGQIGECGSNDDELTCETAVWNQTQTGIKPPFPRCPAPTPPTNENYGSSGCKKENKWWINLIAVVLLLVVLYLLMRGVNSASSRNNRKGRRGGKKSRRGSRVR